MQGLERVPFQPHGTLSTLVGSAGGELGINIGCCFVRCCGMCWNGVLVGIFRAEFGRSEGHTAEIESHCHEVHAEEDEGTPCAKEPDGEGSAG